LWLPKNSIGQPQGLIIEIGQPQGLPLRNKPKIPTFAPNDNISSNNMLV
jgi:hypothetical protein